MAGSDAVSGAQPATRISHRRGLKGRTGDAGEYDVIPLARPVIGEAEERAVLEVLRSGQLSLGPRVEQFEELMCANVGAQCASAVSSGTAGLHMAVRAVGVGAGDEVVTSPLSFVASANAVVYEGARPVFADIDPVTLNLDPGAAAAAVTERTKAMLPVHIFGYPADMPAFEKIAEQKGIAIVEDACEALGARHADGVAVGGRGNPAVFGFYANKQITTGEGGMVTLGDRAMKERIDSERNQGRAKDMGWLDHDRLGFNYRLSDVACALGIAQLRRLDEMLADRARVAGWYREALREMTDLSSPSPPSTSSTSSPSSPSSSSSSLSTPSTSINTDALALPCEDLSGDERGWFVFVVQVPQGVDRDETVKKLAKRGVQSKPYLPAIHLMSYYREKYGHKEGEFPVCEDVAARSLALPFYPEMSEGQVARVAEVLGSVLGR
jgi:perosamine synthetase